MQLSKAQKAADDAQRASSITACCDMRFADLSRASRTCSCPRHRRLQMTHRGPVPAQPALQAASCRQQGLRQRPPRQRRRCVCVCVCVCTRYKGQRLRQRLPR
eukprot:1150803-Pelagomonas_calceolata.AAC.1